MNAGTPDDPDDLALRDPDAWGELEPIDKPARLDATISVRFSADELAALRAQAESAGMKVTAYIRRAALDAGRPPVDRPAVARLLQSLATETGVALQATVPGPRER